MTMVWEFPADSDAWPCPGVADQPCGGLTEDPYGGPCRACWDSISGAADEADQW